MTLDQLFQKRVKQHYKEVFIYLKRVFNDHFVLLALIFLGAMGFAYSEYTARLEVGAILPRVVLVFIVMVLLSIGTVATLLKEADLVFLLPEEEGLFPLLKKALYRSFVLFILPIGMISAAAMPLLVAAGSMEFTHWPLLFGAMLGLKWMDLLFKLYCFIEKERRTKIIGRWSIVLTQVAVLFLSIFYNVIIGMTVAITLAIFESWLLSYRVNSQKRIVQWEDMVEKEQNRQYTLYRFFNLFTDIPSLQNYTRRLKVMDRLIKTLSKRTNNAYYYYYLRVFFRNTSYSGLVLRLTIIGVLLVTFSDILLVTLIINLSTLYLIGFQLLPLANTVQKQLQFQLYPVDSTGKIKAIKQFIVQVLLLISVVFALIGLIHGINMSLYLVFANSLFTLGFTFIYLPRRVKE